ncbi:MAG: DUF1553 domain-containing protein [Planctomycetaceae bacterium]|jgi:hypothetical protein|nr:DUF1553 domain-containing protein [Planctomycetaceae bacterium]MBT6485852.1 DUF1553 domain-containing protein [Planctomycetaceae bacterium]MBT6495519.1 DUF1553 domain-containing protein [Planctomycetaceae bacterium]
MSIRHSNTHFHRTRASAYAAAVFALLVAISVAGLANAADDAPVSTNDNVAPPVQFLNDVVPLLTRLHCNSGGCHGKATGQNGFRLSLLGFEPDFDYAALVSEARGRRLFPADPDQSLLLTKATGVVPHGGGRRLNIDSDDYRVLREWIAAGAPAPRPDDPHLVRLELKPKRGQLQPKSQQQLRVTAHFSDGTNRDVTQQSVYLSNVPEIADVDRGGLITTQPRVGLFAVMVRFGDQLGAYYGAVPRAEASLGNTVGNAAALSNIDRHLLAGWNRLGIEPSPPADDAAFIRRASLDICATLPTADEVTAYLNDTRANKRKRLIDRLLDRPEYATYFALKWADILQNRGRGYSTRKQRPGTTLFSAWIRDSIAANKPYDQFAAEILTATGSQQQNPPAIWYRSVRTQQDYVESVAQAFLGVRIQCAQCHHHPAEFWSQADYYGLAAVFSRVGRKGGFTDAEVPTNETIYLKQEGEVRHPRTGKVLQPRPLGGPDFDLSPYDDPRQAFARWMTAPDNRFFARTMANRLWGHFMGRGIIHPIDDARSTNPPSNPELLDELAREFVKSRYDIKHLIRLITTSSAYGLSSVPNETNKDDLQNFARFYPRRLSAEVLLDGISQVLEVPTQFSGGPGVFPPGTRAIGLPDENVPMNFLDVFGRPARTSACECERSDAPALAQALELVNSTEIQKKLTAKDGTVARLAASKKAPAEIVREIFLSTLARPPSPEEKATAVEFVNSESDRSEAYRSLLWSLLATNEFLLNH